mgnify:FL=1
MIRRLFNEVFKAAESHINTECVCPSQEGINRRVHRLGVLFLCLPLVRGDESRYLKIKIFLLLSVPRMRDFLVNHPQNSHFCGGLFKFFHSPFSAYCMRNKKINTKKERKNSYDAKRKNNTGTYQYP